MKWNAIIITAILLIFGGTVYSIAKNPRAEQSEPVVTQPVEPYKPTQPNTTEIFTLVNQERVKAGVKPLVIDKRLNRSAQVKANDMVTNKYYDHVNPTTGRHGYDIAHEFMPECVYTSENLNAWATRSWVTSQTTVDSWMKSKAHHDAILNTKYVYVGYAVEGDYIVMHLCSI